MKRCLLIATAYLLIATNASSCATNMTAMKNCLYAYKKDEEGYHKTDWSVCEEKKILGLF